MHFNVAVAIKRTGKNKKQLEEMVIDILCERIPDLLDTFDSDNMKRMTVSQFRKRKGVVQTLYGYFDQYRSYSTNLTESSIQDGLLYNMDDHDYIYIVDCHI